MKSMLCGVLALSLLTLVGCETKLSLEKTYTISPGSVQSLTVDSVSREQQLKVTAEADNPISVFVYLEDDKDEVQSKVDSNLTSEKMLANAKDTTEVDLTATVPANKTAIVDVTARSPDTTVTMKLTN